MSYMIVTKVKSIVWVKYILAECRIKSDTGRWERTLLVDWGEDTFDSDDSSLRKFTSEHVTVYDESKVIPQTDLNQGLSYLLDLYDNNVSPFCKNIKMYSYFPASKPRKAAWFNSKAIEIGEKNYCLRGLG